jgi:hypothetical protein
VKRRVFVGDVDPCPQTEQSPDLRHRWWDRLPAGTAGVVLLIGWALGHLRGPGFSTDEVFSARFATQPLDVLVKDLWSGSANMGPYYLVLHFWALVSTSEAWLRILSTIGAAVAVWALSALVRRWTNSYAMAAGSGVVLALIPAFRHLAVEARANSWACALVVVATLAITRSADGSLRLRVGTYGPVMGLAVALNLVAVLAFAVPASLIILAGNRLKWLGSFAGAASVAFLVFAPFAHAYWLLRDSEVAWIPSLSIRGFVAYGFGDGLQMPLSLTWAALTAVFVIAAAVALALAAFPTFGRGSGLEGVGDPAQRIFLTIAGVGTLAPPILLAIVSVLIKPMMYTPFLAFTIPFAVAATVGATYYAVPRLSSNRSLRIVLVSSVLVVVTLLSLVRMPWSTERRVSEDFRSATSFLESSSKRTDVVVFENFVIYGFAWYGFLDNRQVFGLNSHGEDAPLEGFDVVPLERFEAGADQVVWWVTRATEAPPAYLADIHASLRDCRSASETRFGLIVLQRYSPVDSC